MGEEVGVGVDVGVEVAVRVGDGVLVGVCDVVVCVADGDEVAARVGRTGSSSLLDGASSAPQPAMTSRNNSTRDRQPPQPKQPQSFLLRTRPVTVPAAADAAE